MNKNHHQLIILDIFQMMEATDKGIKLYEKLYGK